MNRNREDDGSEIRQAQKDKYCMFSLICTIKGNQTQRRREQNSGCRDWG
jgi:hypothetical protein